MLRITRTIDTQINLDTSSGVNFNSSLFDSHLFSHFADDNVWTLFAIVECVDYISSESR